MKLSELTAHIREKRSYLCVGLDPDPERMPEHLKGSDDPLYEFCKGIIDATQEHCVAFKPNTAFFEAQGVKGWEALERTIRYIKLTYPRHFTIADAKRGDIGNTARQYARTFFETLPFDSVTVAPYMGADSVEPFLEWGEKYAILLALTSNAGAGDFQLQPSGEAALYERVIRTSRNYQGAGKLMYVVGATQADYLRRIRALLDDSFLLVPGVGSQGGSVEEVCEAARSKNEGLLINVSRSVIYASSDEDFAEAAAEAALVYRRQMSVYVGG